LNFRNRDRLRRNLVFNWSFSLSYAILRLCTIVVPKKNIALFSEDSSFYECPAKIGENLIYPQIAGKKESMLINSPAASGEKQRVRIKYSPIVEIASSLHCLERPESCPQFEETFQKVLRDMPPEMRSDFDYLSEVTVSWTLAIDLFCYLEQHEIESAKGLLAAFPKLSDIEFIYGMLSGLAPKRTIGRLVKQPQAVSTWSDNAIENFIGMGLARRIVAESSQIHERMARFLKWYWDNVFEEIWRSIGAAEIGCMGVEKKVLAAMSESAYLETCHPGLKVVRGSLTVVDVPECSWQLGDVESIDVFLSAFSGSSLIVNQFDGVLTLFKRIAVVDLESDDIGLEELAEFLKSISSSTKFQILKELYNSPKTTKELAEALDMAPSSISEHLKTLRAAELLYPQRVKNSVYNRFLYENYQAFASRLLTYFDQ